MSTLLAKSRDSFGAAPRKVAAWDNLTPPSWMKQDDALRATYPRAIELLRTGDIVWGHVVQANSLLFAPGDSNGPAQVLFGARADVDLEPDVLRRASHAAFALRGRTLADPALARIGRALAEETARHEPLDVPDAVTHGFPMRMAIVMVHRAQLPSKYLSSNVVPLLASRERDAATIFPSRYWSEDLVRGWIGIGARVA
jgi:hypothetical protein